MKVPVDNTRLKTAKQRLDATNVNYKDINLGALKYQKPKADANSENVGKVDDGVSIFSSIERGIKSSSIGQQSDVSKPSEKGTQSTT